MTHSRSTFGKRADVRRHFLRSCCVGVILLSTAFALPASAEEPLPDVVPLVEVEVMTPEMHRAELRRALTSEVDRDGIQERRKLSGREREALHRDLRDAMRNVNADHDSRGERKPR